MGTRIYGHWIALHTSSKKEEEREEEMGMRKNEVVRS
jgi:hypothetical protein